MGRRDLHHDIYKSLLLSGGSRRTINARIVSDRHQVSTIYVNKVSLSTFDDKRYYLDDGISTRAYGHYLNDTRYFEEAIANDLEWDGRNSDDDFFTLNVDECFDERNPDVQSSAEDVDGGQDNRNVSLDQPSRQATVTPTTGRNFSVNAWTPPDFGFYRTNETESEAGEQPIADLDNLSDQCESPTERNSFILDEAVESNDEEDEPRPPTKKRRAFILEDDDL